ncbi:MAG: hypothetical protein IKN57_09735 [Parasporobacterium sp.]|nr:hypothetical protein [Parasporobacterium sp.]MCR4684143.1 hypothetical protein [Lachnospiraceae bacterium]
MQKTTQLTTLEVLLMVFSSFLAGAIGGVIVHSVYKRLTAPTICTQAGEKKAADDFHDDLVMEMSELR